MVSIVSYSLVGAFSVIVQLHRLIDLRNYTHISKPQALVVLLLATSEGEAFR